jgi:hypothetical protein
MNLIPHLAAITSCQSVDEPLSFRFKIVSSQRMNASLFHTTAWSLLNRRLGPVQSKPNAQEVMMTQSRVAGIEPGQRRLNGPQTTGRELSQLVTAPVFHDPG